MNMIIIVCVSPPSNSPVSIIIIIIVNDQHDYYDHDDDRIDGKSIRIRFRSFVNIEKIAKQNQEKNRWTICDDKRETWLFFQIESTENSLNHILDIINHWWLEEKKMIKIFHIFIENRFFLWQHSSYITYQTFFFTRFIQRFIKKIYINTMLMMIIIKFRLSWSLFGRKNIKFFHVNTHITQTNLL